MDMAVTCLSVQGDGTALIFQDEPAVFTVSVHGASNFPSRKQKSSLDVPLPDNTEDAAYLRYCGLSMGVC